MATHSHAGALASNTTLIYLVRHGVTEWTEAGKNSGGDDLGPALTETGRNQARGAAAAITSIAAALGQGTDHLAVRASPMVRAAETATIIASQLGLTEPEELPMLAEIRFGAWQGLTDTEVDDTWPGQRDEQRRSATLRPPGGETQSETQARADQALATAVADHPGGAILSAHSVIGRLLVASVLDMPAHTWGSVRLVPGSVTMLEVSDGDVSTAVLRSSGVPPQV